MKIKMRRNNNTWVLEIEGLIKSGMEFEIADQLESCIDQSQVPKIIVDMKKVEYINSAVLGIFLNIFREVERMNGRFSLCGLNSEIDDLLDITKLSSVFEIFKNREDALDSFQD